jgi:hypothetical protein
MAPSKTATLVLAAPLGQRSKVEAVLKSVQGVSYTHDRGFWLRKFAVVGSPEALANLQPKIEAWSREYLSADAW